MLRKRRKFIGYKIMRVSKNVLVSGANSRLTFSSAIGKPIFMPGKGIFLSTNRKYVIDNYAGYHDEEVLLTLLFNEQDIVWGKNTLHDREPELGVRQAVITNIERYD